MRKETHHSHAIGVLADDELDGVGSLHRDRQSLVVAALTLDLQHTTYFARPLFCRLRLGKVGNAWAAASVKWNSESRRDMMQNSR
jgi:hypothetical protein